MQSLLEHHRSVKLGKQPAQQRMGVPLLRRYLPDDIPVPDVADWTFGRTTFPMGGNDTTSDCTSISKGHGLSLQLRAGRGKLWDPTTPEALNFYEQSCGYNPHDPSTDQGGIMIDVLTYFLKHGWNGWRIQGFGQITLGDIHFMHRCVYEFGFVDGGFSLPLSAQGQELWDVPKGGPVGDGKPNSWGGHDALIAVSDLNKGRVKILTWTGLQEATFDFLDAYLDEAYGWKSNAFIGVGGKAPNGLNSAQLDADMAKLAA